jgi:hypothetical protein
MKAFMDAFWAGRVGPTMTAAERLAPIERLALALFMGGSLRRSCFGAEVGRG